MGDQQEMKIVGKLIEPFNPQTMDWVIYEKLLNNMLTLNGVNDDARKKMHIMGLIGMHAYTELCHAMEGKDIAALTSENLFEMLRDRYAPKKLVVAQRDKFLGVKQKPDQSLAELVAELQHVATACDFEKITSPKEAREAFMLQGFLRALKSESTRIRLLQQENLSFKKAFEIASVLEEADKEGPTMGKAKENMYVGNVQKGYQRGRSRGRTPFRGQNRGNSRSPSPGRGRKPCWRCNKEHEYRKCPAFGKKCNKCGEQNHFGINCRGRNSRRESPGRNNQQPRHQTNNIGHGYANHFGYDTDDFEGILHAVSTDEHSSVGSCAYEPPRNLSIRLDGKAVSFELDTGAAPTIITERDWKRIGQPKLEPVSGNLTAYQGHAIKTLGQCTVDAQLDGKRARTAVFVVSNGVALCGRSMISALKIDCGPYYATSVHQAEVDTPTLDEILEANQEVFNNDSGSVKECAKLMLKADARPRYLKFRKVPYALKDKIEQELNRQVDENVLSPVDKSDWATPIVVVPKPGNQIRMCGDFKVTVNPCLDLTEYPMPKPEDLFQALNGGKKFTKLDLKNAYLQIPLDEESKNICVITTHKGLYRYNRLPFGVAEAPKLFQKLMEKLLHGIEGVIIYLDDITVTGATDQEHLRRLKLVLERLKQHGLRLKKQKCEFLKNEVELLGRIIDANGVRPNPKKVEAIVKMPDPQNLKELESFLGMVNYYCRFVANLADKTAPLNKLKKKDARWTWGETEKSATEAIRKELSNLRILAHFDPSEEVVLATDASDYGLGAVVFHRYKDRTQKVIAYASRTLTVAEKGYSQIDKEACGIVYGVEKFNEYLYGRKFVLQTDHQPLVRLFGPKHELPVIAAKRLHRWALKLMMYSFDIEYVSTHDFGNADGLSRLPNPSEKPSISQLKEHLEVDRIQNSILWQLPITYELVRFETAKDTTLEEVKDLMYADKKPENLKTHLLPYYRTIDKLHIHRGVLLKNHRVVIPESLRERVLTNLHSTHSGITRMQQIARTYVWWPGMDQDIESVASRCEECCQQAPNMPKTPLHMWEKPDRAWQRIHIDYAGPENGRYWLIVVDAKSKWPECIQTSGMTAVATIRALMTVFATHGLAETIVSDNGPAFTSGEFSEFCKAHGIVHQLTAPYHPASNGLAERFVQTFKQFLKKLDKPKYLDIRVAEFLLTYRSAPHPATNLSPAEVLMGRKLRIKLDMLKPLGRTNAMELTKYEKRTEYNFNKKVRFREFEPGNEVWIREYLSKKYNWRKAIVLEQIGSNYYLVECEGRKIKQSADQMKRRKPPINCKPFDVTEEYKLDVNERYKWWPKSTRTISNFAPVWAYVPSQNVDDAMNSTQGNTEDESVNDSDSDETVSFDGFEQPSFEDNSSENGDSTSSESEDNESDNDREMVNISPNQPGENDENNLDVTQEEDEDDAEEPGIANNRPRRWAAENPRIPYADCGDNTEDDNSTYVPSRGPSRNSINKIEFVECDEQLSYANSDSQNSIKEGEKWTETSFVVCSSTALYCPHKMSDVLDQLRQLLEKRDRSRSRSPHRRRSPEPSRNRYGSKPRFDNRAKKSASQEERERQQRVDVAKERQTQTATVAAQHVAEKMLEKLSDMADTFNDNAKTINDNVKTINDNIITLNERLEQLEAEVKNLQRVRDDKSKSTLRNSH